MFKIMKSHTKKKKKKEKKTAHVVKENLLLKKMKMLKPASWKIEDWE